ncbi:hypothetical protein [Apilactobacillus ozensis]|uniref:hypothetical protein n=1 Tax=Apilactobacillus ozensis TaxID=866801 RepID=UPI00200AD8E1|nr:hypothetical protein [Apilactobacillus ozensis]MCK8606851.1 hypothetical protein [Apilactobacillus ozensis]
MKIKKMFKHIHFWHQFMKKGKYKKYEQKYYRDDYKCVQSKTWKKYRKNQSDYQCGYNQADVDVNNGNKICHYPYRMMKFINKYFVNGKIHEVVEYMHGYNDYLKKH